MSTCLAAAAGMDIARHYADWPRRAPFTCGSCGAVSNFRCHHERPLAQGDRVRVQLSGEAAFTGTIQVIQVTAHGGLADVQPDDLDLAVVSVAFGPQGAQGQPPAFRSAA